ncbi:hypothetical protein JHW43_002849 [Diplocarpon mali]|nr:hypothetical protein JHW43_002849 [Diplocarpon mali]
MQRFDWPSLLLSSFALTATHATKSLGTGVHESNAINRAAGNHAVTHKLSIRESRQIHEASTRKAHPKSTSNTQQPQSPSEPPPQRDIPSLQTRDSEFPQSNTTVPTYKFQAAAPPVEQAETTDVNASISSQRLLLFFSHSPPPTVIAISYPATRAEAAQEQEQEQEQTQKR